MIGMAALDFLINLDITLLRFGNTTLANPLFDTVMPVITSIDFWRYPVLLTLAGIAVFGGRYGLATVLVGIILLVISDQLSSQLLKDFFGRLRPCHDVPDIRVLTGCGNTKSFPSSHATNTIAAAVFFGLRYRRILSMLLGISIVVSFSRVYIGIHYPGDLLAGWVLGALCALTIFMIFSRTCRRWPQIERTRRWKWMNRIRRQKKDARSV